MAEYEDDSEGPLSDKVRQARAKLTAFTVDMGEWRQEATEAYACVAGDQWDDSIRNQLEEEGRPVFTFNRVAGFIRGICGLETSTRNQVTFYPRELGDSGLGDVVNAAVRWVRQECDADDEESDAFKDMLTCGIGWTETLFTSEEDPEGKVVVERVDPLHMRWDPAARKRGLTDRRWNARIKWLHPSTIRDVWGKAKADEVMAMIDTDTEVLDEFSSTPHDATKAHEYESDNLGQARRRTGVPVVQYQYFETATFYRVLNPATGVTEELNSDQYAELTRKLQEVGVDVPGQKYRKRQYRQLIFCGTVELEDEALPCDGFTFQPITGIRDRNNGTWYGFVRDMIDPQRWINKFFSSMADVVASQAKGGLLAETDAFVDKQQAEDSWADPRSIVWMRSGALVAGKVKERQSAGLPAGFSQLLEFTVGSLPHVAGVNLEFLGLAGREQAGVLETQRKQAAIATLAEFFNALRLYRKQQGRILIQFINEFISDGRLVRIVGKKDEQFVPLMKMPGSLQYDIVVDEAPNSPDQKQRTWEALMQIIPAAAKMGFPIPPSIVEYAPFPQALVQEWQQFAQGEAGLPPEMKEKIQQMQEELQALQKENEKLKTGQEIKMAELQMKQMEGQQDIQLEREKVAADIQLERERAMAQIQLEREKAMLQLQLEQEKAQTQLGLQQEQARMQMGMQAEQSRAQMEHEREKFEAEHGLAKDKMMGEQMLRAMESGEGGAEDGQEGAGKAPGSRKVGSLVDALTSAQNETKEAMTAMAAAIAELAKAQRAPRKVIGGNGREYNMIVGE